MNNRRLIAKGIRDAVPIILAYFPIAMTFGVISTGNGIPWLVTILISVWVYAGGAQFMLVSLALAGSSVISTVATVLLVNLRHFLYGTSLGPAFIHWSEPKKWLSAFGLTDEVFVVASNRYLQEPPFPRYHLAFVFACYGSWLAGTLVGASIGQTVPAAVSQILGFALPALFLALLLSSKRSGAHIAAAIFGAILAVAAHLLQLGNVGLVVGAVIGATLGLICQNFVESCKQTNL
ncbi:AzlC family ABC transporter permease [Fodinisporobacter ferrooxydans]|uniref:AzlC family ABC transporter permease n=1 Tax=Fodinisporobacter ferrooxydans TaxID=2901836 RepID=A0ABY4CKP2_9BACL|nr:AzlC family ABC transporter permease [Alicyclobacillaceae bacterium MYW30-H2]